MSSLKMIKKDALIPITVGSGIYQRLSALAMYLADDRTSEEMKAFETHVKEQKELPEPWMEHLFTTIILLQEIEKSADENGHTYEQSLDNTTTQ